MEIIRTIDLWTEQHDNHYECFNGAFTDGVRDDSAPFDNYKVIKNCNCVISVSDENIKIKNKHNAIIFYDNRKPIRLIVINKDTDIDKCIKNALNNYYLDSNLEAIYKKLNINQENIDLLEKPIEKEIIKEEIDVGSCDRWALLKEMLKGNYTEDEVLFGIYGNYQDNHYEYLPNLKIKYDLVIENEHFIIEHKCAFINSIKTRLIPIQENSKLTNS